MEADHRRDELEFMNTLKGMTELKAFPPGEFRSRARGPRRLLGSDWRLE